jgi:hypothetical protein
MPARLAIARVLQWVALSGVSSSVIATSTRKRKSGLHGG